MSSYAWVIDKDCLSIPGHAYDESGTIGPRDATDAQVETLKFTKSGKQFRMFDDDNIMLYEGRYIGPEDESMFCPLDDFGGPNAGATYIKYRNKHKWEIL